MEFQEPDAGALGLGSGRSYRFVTRLVWLYGAFTILAILALLPAVAPFAWLSVLRAQAMEAISGGMAGLVIASLLMALTTLCATQVVTAARRSYGLVGDVELSPQGRLSFLRFGPGIAARQGQAIVIGLGAVLTCYASWFLWPMSRAVPLAGASPNLIGAIVVGVAFCSLVGERMMAAFPAPQMPEAPALRRVLLMTTVLLAAAGALEIGRGSGLLWVYWVFVVLSLIPWIATIELALRSFARMFLPPPQPAEAKAVADSIFLALITGGPRAPGVLIRTHLGLDFARSWALQYLTSAALPAVFGTALLCWGLSGLKLIDLSERGIYERFGAPVAVLGPGIHLLLPWPLGIMRPLEYGTLHEIKVGSSQPDNDGPVFGAEAIPPPSANHLWDTADPTEAEYLVPSPGTGAQSFQAVDAEIHVLFRTGLTDADAMASVYAATDPAQLVRETAARVVSLYFATNTLDSVMRAQRDQLAESLRAAVARDIGAYHAGIDIVSVHIESVHPPIGAAAAYHAVQAAEINANASISQEAGRAKRTAGIADQEAHQAETTAQAAADETIQDAKGDAYQFAADRKAYAEGSTSFLMERQFAADVQALSQVRLTVVDSRLTAAQAPIIDLRGIDNGAANAGGAANGGAAAATARPGGGANLTPGVEDAN